LSLRALSPASLNVSRFLLLIASATLAFSFSSPSGLALDVGGDGGCCRRCCGICDFNPCPLVPSLARLVRGQPEEMLDSGLGRAGVGKRVTGEAEQPSPRWLLLHLACVNSQMTLSPLAPRHRASPGHRVFLFVFHKDRSLGGAAIKVSAWLACWCHILGFRMTVWLFSCV